MLSVLPLSTWHIHNVYHKDTMRNIRLGGSRHTWKTTRSGHACFRKDRDTARRIRGRMKNASWICSEVALNSETRRARKVSVSPSKNGSAHKNSDLFICRAMSGLEKAGPIHDVLRLPFEPRSKISDCGVEQSTARFAGRPCNMGSNDAIFSANERTGSPGRFNCENIQAGASQPSGIQGFRQFFFDDQSASRSVDQDSGWFHLCDARGIYQPVGRRLKWAMKRDNVGTCENLIDTAPMDA